MPIKSNKSIEEQIPNGKHLTFVDKMRASFMHNVGQDEVGNTTNPREDWLRQQAQKRARENKEKK